MKNVTLNKTFWMTCVFSHVIICSLQSGFSKYKYFEINTLIIERRKERRKSIRFPTFLRYFLLSHNVNADFFSKNNPIAAKTFFQKVQLLSGFRNQFLLLLLVAVFPKSFFTFVRRNFMTLSFFTARHWLTIFKSL